MLRVTGFARIIRRLALQPLPWTSARERAALEWTEALTLVSATRVQDEVYERMREQCSEDELVHLSLANVSINGGPAVRGGCAGVRCSHRHSRCCLTGLAPGAGRDERRAAQRERRVFDGPLRFTPEGKTYRVESGDNSADRGNGVFDRMWRPRFSPVGTRWQSG